MKGVKQEILRQVLEREFVLLCGFREGDGAFCVEQRAKLESMGVFGYKFSNDLVRKKVGRFVCVGGPLICVVCSPAFALEKVDDIFSIEKVKIGKRIMSYTKYCDYVQSVVGVKDVLFLLVSYRRKLIVYCQCQL